MLGSHTLSYSMILFLPISIVSPMSTLCPSTGPFPSVPNPTDEGQLSRPHDPFQPHLHFFLLPFVTKSLRSDLFSLSCLPYPSFCFLMLLELCCYTNPSSVTALLKATSVCHLARSNNWNFNFISVYLSIASGIANPSRTPHAPCFFLSRCPLLLVPFADPFSLLALKVLKCSNVSILYPFFFLYTLTP